MAGGAAKYRHLNRNSAHRQSLLRNLVTSLFKHEAITTTWGKAKEAQRIAEKLVTLGKKNTSASKRRAGQIFFEPTQLVPRLFTQIAPRYASRPGGYTRCLRLGPRNFDAADGAILSLVDGPKDMRYFMTAQTVARDRSLGVPSTAITEVNVRKCCQSWRAKMTAPEELPQQQQGGGSVGVEEGDVAMHAEAAQQGNEEAMVEARRRFEETVEWFVTLERAERDGKAEVVSPDADRGLDALYAHRVPEALYPQRRKDKVKRAGQIA